MQQEYHMAPSELSHKNFRRISLINWVISIPFVLIFAWPYLMICHFFSLQLMLSYIGALFFSVPLMITILHGHVTMALGAAHRQHYYDWLKEHSLSFGLLYHPLVIRTRFRLIVLLLSFIVLAIQFILHLS